MKKIIFILTLCFSTVFMLNGNGVSAAENNKGYNPTNLEISKLNQELQGLVEEVNDRLAKGEENVVVSSKNLTVGFKLNDTTSLQRGLNSYGVQASSIGSKSYQAYVINTNGFDFSHGLYGTFTWNGKVLSGVTADEELAGPMYAKKADTKIQYVDGRVGIDAGIARITSKGTFTFLKYSWINFYTTLIVEVYAPTKEYRIITAKITE